MMLLKLIPSLKMLIIRFLDKINAYISLFNIIFKAYVEAVQNSTYGKKHFSHAIRGAS